MIMLITLSTGLRPKNCRFNFIFLQSIILILLQVMFYIIIIIVIIFLFFVVCCNFDFVHLGNNSD